jgi:hypothetical protein
MSLSQTALSAIQQAGQSLHQATVVVCGAVREQAQHMVETVASQPLQAEGEQAFANFRMLARLSQDLQAMEAQLRSLYASASELASPEMDVLATPARAAPRSRIAAAGADALAEDAVIKPAAPRRAPSRPQRRTADRAAGLTANDRKVLGFLQTVLTARHGTSLTVLQMARGSGLPLGSVGVSLQKVLASGAVKKIGRSAYQLAG